MFKDVNGKISAKRILGSICILAGILALFIFQDPLLTTPCFATGLTLLGLGVTEKKVEN